MLTPLLSTYYKQYFDTNGDENAHTVYTKSSKSFSLKGGKTPTAIIAGCFELSPQFWFERNILGRLLSVAMGAAHLQFDGDKTAVGNTVIQQHKEYCMKLSYGKTVCDMNGTPMIPSVVHRLNWKADWVVWKADICKRLTDMVPRRNFRSFQNAYVMSIAQANMFYWNNFPLVIDPPLVMQALPSPTLAIEIAMLKKHVVPHTGVILDTVNSMVLPSRLTNIIEDDVAALGFNLVQLRLIDNYGFTVKLAEESQLGFSLTSGPASKLYRLQEDLAPIVANAAKLGVEMMPEISVSTDGGGWFNTGFMMPCAEHFCHSKHTPNNVNDAMLVPVVWQAIGALRKVFSSKFIHLGSDEREATAPCFDFLRVRANFDGFEDRLARTMEENGIHVDSVLRHENTEHKHYPGRAGSITQYRAGSANVQTTGQFFATVDVLEGSAWDVYQRTKAIVAKQPLGVMAELRALLKALWDKVELQKRLLAYAMAVSELPTANDEATFNGSYRSICQALSWATDCTPPAVIPKPESVLYAVESTQLHEKMCNARTFMASKHLAKKVVPHFKDAVAAKAAKDKATSIQK